MQAMVSLNSVIPITLPRMTAMRFPTWDSIAYQCTRTESLPAKMSTRLVTASQKLPKATRYQGHAAQMRPFQSDSARTGTSRQIEAPTQDFEASANGETAAPTHPRNFERKTRFGP